MTNQAQQPLQVTSADQWGIETVKFPSGNVAKLQRPSVLRLAIELGGSKEVPDYLQGSVIAGITGEKPPAITAAMLPDIEIAFNKLCLAAFVEPQVSEGAEPGKLQLCRIADFDKIWLYVWAMGADGESATSFLEQPLGDMAAVLGQQNSGSPAKPVHQRRKR